MQANEQIDLVNLFIVLLGSGFVGYLTGVVGRRFAWENSAWYAFATIGMMIGMAILSSMFIKGGYLLPILGLYLGTSIDSRIQARAKAKAAKAKFESDSAALQKSVDALLASRTAADTAQLDVTEMDEAVVNAIIETNIKRGLTIISQKNHNTGARALSIAGQVTA